MSSNDVQTDELKQTMNTNINNNQDVTKESSSPTDVKPTDTTQIPELDSNKQSSTVSTEDHGNSLPNKSHPTVRSEPSTFEIPDSGINKQATTVSTEDHGNSLPTETQQTTTSEPSISQVPDSHDNNLDTTKVATSNQETDSGDQTTRITSNNEAKKDTSLTYKIDSDDLGTNNDNPTNDRAHLMNLIHEDLKFVKYICAKYERYQHHITKEAEKASEVYKKLKEDVLVFKKDPSYNLTELKDLKRRVIRLKLQIPAKYRTYDDKDQQKIQKLFLDNRGLISAKLLNKLPRLHNKLFHESLFCKTMQQRYNNLSLAQKFCLLCFSVFPENEEISRRLMVYWWIAEGLIPGEDDPEKTLEDHANEFFTELMDNDFIEPAASRIPDCYVATCKMQPMIRAALVMISDKVKFLDFDEFGDPKDFGKFDEIESPEEMPDIHPLGDPREFFDFFNEQREKIPIDRPIDFLDSEGNPILFAPYNQNYYGFIVDCIGNPIDTTKRYYFYQKKYITMKSCNVCLMGTGLSNGLSWEKLHMLFNVKDDILEFKLEWFLRMKNVSILFLGRWQSSAAHHIEVEELKLKEGLEHMTHVRFFSLQGVSRITELPESISRLESLLILDLRACHYLEKIPKTIGSLKHLTHLDMSECYFLKDIPKEISSLESLQVLKGFVVVDSLEKHVCDLQDLEKLKHLRKLSISTHMKDFPRELHLDVLQKLEALRKLTIFWKLTLFKMLPRQKNVEGSTRRMNAFNTSTLGQKKVEGSMRRMNAFNTSTLEKLDLKCFPDNRTPTWLTPGNLKGLKKLYIRGGWFSDLGQYQDIYECGDSLNIPKDTWNVKVLRLKYLNELKMEWTEVQNLFPEMTYLEKVNCPKLAMFPCNEHGVWQKPSTSG